ncbi:MAG: cysteine-rich CWC family protein [Ferruginibacter sp.]
MSSHEHKYCPLCNNLFECKAGSILQCQCSQVHLSEEAVRFIEDSFADCLCIKCLQEIKEKYILINK